VDGPPRHSTWNCPPSSLCTNFIDKLLREQPPSNFCIRRELLHVLERKMQRMRKRLNIANKIMRFWVLVLRNPYCPLQSQKMFLVEASTNFSFAIVAKVNLDREGAEIAQRLFSLVR
jgi:hypothetical protein